MNINCFCPVTGSMAHPWKRPAPARVTAVAVQSRKKSRRVIPVPFICFIFLLVLFYFRQVLLSGYSTIKFGAKGTGVILSNIVVVLKMFKDFNSIFSLSSKCVSRHFSCMRIILSTITIQLTNFVNILQIPINRQRCFNSTLPIHMHLKLQY